MSDSQGCINKCMAKSVDGADPVPRPATRGRLCGGCWHRLADWLLDIPVDYALLPMVLSSGGSQMYDGSGRTKQPEAPAPLRLDVAALTDVSRGYSGVRDPGDELWYELADIPSVLSVLHAQAEHLRCDLDPAREWHDITQDNQRVFGEANYLSTAISRLAEADWVDEAMAELKTVWAALTRAHGYIAGSAVGPCLTAACDGKVYRDRFTGFPECNTCHRVYEGRDVLKVQLTEEAATA